MNESARISISSPVLISIWFPSSPRLTLSAIAVRLVIGSVTVRATAGRDREGLVGTVENLWLQVPGIAQVHDHARVSEGVIQGEPALHHLQFALVDHLVAYPGLPLRIEECPGLDVPGCILVIDRLLVSPC